MKIEVVKQDGQWVYKQTEKPVVEDVITIIKQTSETTGYIDMLMERDNEQNGFTQDSECS